MKPTTLFETTKVAQPLQLDTQEIIVSPVQNQLSTRVLSKDVESLFADNQNIVLFGVPEQKALGASLGTLLQEVTKGNSPVLFALFEKMGKDIEGLNLQELQDQIKASQKKSFLEKIGLSSVAKRLKKATEEFDSLMTSKSTSLLDLTNKMEKDLQVEAASLAQGGSSLERMAEQYRKHIVTLQGQIGQGQKYLDEAKQYSQYLTDSSTQNGDTLAIQDSKTFAQKVSLFESRVVALEILGKQAPTELESIRLGLGAVFSTLAEIAGNADSEFNQIKSILIRLSVSNKTQNNQALTDMRRGVRDKLQEFSGNQLEEVVIKAEQSKSLNRLEDAKQLLAFATKMSNINARLATERDAGALRFAEVRTTLEQVQKLVDRQEAK